MRKLLFLCLSFILFSCNDIQEGDGVNPMLNLSTYTFPKEGGSIDVYSTIGYDLQVYYQPQDGQDETVEKNENSITGSWFKVEWDYNGKNIRIEVQPNETASERIVPINIMSFNFGCRVKYDQKNN